jgi:hypothetical protein
MEEEKEKRRRENDNSKPMFWKELGRRMFLPQHTTGGKLDHLREVT